MNQRNRLKKKKKSSDDDDDEEFRDVPFYKSVSAPVKKTTGTKKSKDEKRQNVVMEEEQQEMEVEDPNTKKVVFEHLNKDKLFSDILTQANNPEFLTILRNLLSGCKQALDGKKKEIEKKKNSLRRNSSYDRDEYIRKEQDMKRMEEEEIREIKEDVISRLGYSKTKGFQTKQQLIDGFKQAHPGYSNYIFDQIEYVKIKQEQFELLQMLMKQPDLVLLPSSNNIIQFTFAPKPKLQQVQKQNRGDIQTDDLLNKFDVQQNPTVQFRFSKQFANINYDKIFQNQSCFKIKQSDQFKMSKKSISWLLDSKSDQIYSNQKFQKQTFQKYSSMLKGILDNTVNVESVTQKTRQQLIEVCTYILNSVHYSQKFKLRYSILHPLDILFVIQKIKAGKH